MPSGGKTRILFLDALRGFAILGIILANFPEFSLWTFQESAEAAALDTWGTDSVVRFLQYVFVDGKFYTLFSLLFGIGFSIILRNAASRGADGMKIFYRRMAGLLVIGILHLLFLWSGDILMLYALMGMLLPPIRKLPSRKILLFAIILLVLPILSDGICLMLGVSLSAPLESAWWRCAEANGITHGNFGTYLRDASTYQEVFRFLKQGAIERMYEFVDAHRYFKVLGLFFIGYVLGREGILTEVAKVRPAIKKVATLGICAGLPLSVLYAWSATSGYPLGSLAHDVIYLLSVYPLAFGYGALFILLSTRRNPGGSGFATKALSYPGRMACTNYIMQSVFGIIIFYGIGFGLGAGVSLTVTELIALGVYSLQILLSMLWLKYFRFGPIEWVWRCFTYGKAFPLTLKKSQESQ